MAHALNAPGELRGRVGPEGQPTAMLDNRTELPDDVVQEAVMAKMAETTSLQFGHPSTFQLYSNSSGTNMLTRSPFRVPSNVIEEIKLARMVAETDDDVSAVIGMAIGTAFGDGMKNQHTDEDSEAWFNRAAKESNLDGRFKEMYREYLIAAQVNTLTLYRRKRMDFQPSGSEKRLSGQLAMPVIGILPAEDIRVLSNDIFGDGELAYDPPDNAIREWLLEYFKADPARKQAMRRDEPIMADMFTEQVKGPWNDPDIFIRGRDLWKLNPRMVHRTTMAKGATPYPRPPITANFALLEAKRLLNIMDYALLQGGTNYIVVAKQGSDQRPAQQPEIDNLADVVRTASRTGVMVGDHRLSIEIITPELKELLNPEKRKLIGRKLAMSILRIPEQVTDDAGGDGAKQEATYTAANITADRRDLKRHVENHIYEETAERNRSTLDKGPATIWFPKIILSGLDTYFASVMKARDRGDLPRAAGVELLGYDYDAQVAQRKREKERGDDEVMQAVDVPFSGNPDDGGEGRPPGSSPNNGTPGQPPVDPAQRQRRIPAPAVRRPRGEPVRAMRNGEQIMRVGELTAAALEEFPDHQQGRITELQREAVASDVVVSRGGRVGVPVNPGYEVSELRSIHLNDHVTMVLGQRDDGAIVAKALMFSEPEYTEVSAAEAALRWGFVSEVIQHAEEMAAREEHQPTFTEVVASALQDPEIVAQLVPALKEIVGGLMPDITVVLPGEEGEVEFVRDPETGAITGKRKKQS